MGWLEGQHGTRWLPVALFVCFFFVGCGENLGPEIEAYRTQFITAAPIAGETSVSSIRKMLAEDGAEESIPVILRGRISAGDLPPWETGVAAFVLTDTTGHDGDDEHDPHTCPFCSRNLDDYMANTYFRDEAGQLIPIDSRKLFNVKENQTVIIQGTGRLGDDDTLEVDAEKMYVRP